jgi:hypothetical protein
MVWFIGVLSIYPTLSYAKISNKVYTYQMGMGKFWLFAEHIKEKYCICLKIKSGF